MNSRVQRDLLTVEPREIKQETESVVSIKWADDRVCQYRAPDLRRVCPCAQCVNEWTGERMLNPKTVSDDLFIEDINIVGRYALNFKWSDGHETGIYSFRYLRDLCEQEDQIN
jgi:DUF971 family protein